MTRPIGNVRLKAARQHAGYGSQQALADALTRAAPQLGLGHIEISTRQIRRWESAARHGRGQTTSGCWCRCSSSRSKTLASRHHGRYRSPDPSLPPPPGVLSQPGTAGRQRFPCRRPAASSSPPPWRATMRPSQPPTGACTPMFSPRTCTRRSSSTPAWAFTCSARRRGSATTILATALAETLLLAGRIEFFDLRQPDDADATFVRALQAAGEADDALLGSAILAHAAFIPGWVSRRDETADRMRAARTYARRGPASAEFLAWLDAVEAECETISGHTREALRLIEHAESHPGRGQPVRLTGLVHLVLPGTARRVQGQHPAQGRAPAAGKGNPDRRPERSVDRRQQAAQRHPRRPGRRRSRPAPPRSRLRLRRSRPSTSSAAPGTPPAWTASSTSARPSSRTPSWTACSASMTGCTTGRPRSARSSVKRGDPAGQLGQRVNPQRRHLTRGRIIPPDHGPRAAVDQRRPQPEPGRRHDVVIQPVTHIQGLTRADRGLPRSSSGRTRDQAW